MSIAAGQWSPVEFRAKKNLGQHFLVDRRVIGAVIEGVRPDPSEVVVEIGPGLGAITFGLAGHVGHLVAVEKDARATAELERRMSTRPLKNVTLVNEDILDFQLEKVAAGFSRKVTVVGNLPYNISKPVLEMLVRNREFVSRAVLMFQSEVADRLLAEPGSKAYGALTVMVRYRALTNLILSVSKDAFRPRPNVTSKVLHLDFSVPHAVKAENDALFDKVVRAAFSHRRKTLLNSLKSSGHGWPHEMLHRVLIDCGIDHVRRAETLSVDEFLRLSDCLGGCAENDPQCRWSPIPGWE